MKKANNLLTAYLKENLNTNKILIRNLILIEILIIQL